MAFHLLLAVIVPFCLSCSLFFCLHIQFDNFIQMPEFCMIRGSNTVQLPYFFEKIRMLAKHVEAISIQRNNCFLWELTHQFGKEAHHYLISAQPRPNNPALNFNVELGKVVQPLLMQCLNLLLGGFMVQLMTGDKERVDNDLGGVRLNGYCCRFSTENMGQIGSCFQGSHRRVEGSTRVLKTATNDSNAPVISLFS